jgi:hypothetical protein
MGETESAEPAHQKFRSEYARGPSGLFMLVRPGWMSPSTWPVPLLKPVGPEISIPRMLPLRGLSSLRWRKPPLPGAGRPLMLDGGDRALCRMA